ncbi:MAG: hypothetical protein IKP77_02955 [Acholeplasmatales bacterium]|nr:hypothetical protein [Acholeplasmatales bacterium]MBR6288708.1 hypothetical protein [Acholeplasmatales bacterium]
MPKTIQDFLKNINTENNDLKNLTNSILGTIYEYEMYKESVKNVNTPSEEVPDFSELLYAIKEKLINIESTGNLEFTSDNDSKFIKSFIFNPISTMTNETKKVDELCDKYMKENPNAKNELSQVSFKNGLIKEDLLNYKTSYMNLEKSKKDLWKEKQNLKSTWFINYFNNGNKMISESLEENKGGLFEQLFHTTSKEYKDFARRLSIIDKEGLEKGDLSGLRQSTYKYLNHKFKDGNFFYSGKNYTYIESQIEKMDKTSQGRVRLCLNVLKSIDNAEKAIEEKLNPDEFTPDNDNVVDNEMLKEVTTIGSMANDVYKEDNTIVDIEVRNIVNKLDNSNFQNEIKNDVDDNFMNLGNDVNIYDNENNVSKELN